MTKPVLFLDFDYTLFDTKLLREWLGENIEERVRAIDRGELELPDCSPMLYPDTLPFMRKARQTHLLVLLTSTAYPAYQKKKIIGSGVVPFLDDMLIVRVEEGYLNRARDKTSPPVSSSKGKAACEYLDRTQNAVGGTVFVDDLPENLSEVKTLLPAIRSIEIRRIERRSDNVPHTELLPPDAIVANLAELLELL
ncbi:MAG: hypothetical protein Q7S52_05700 [bacterium]|nr:hypothetical protein [bacterium]